MLKHVKEAKARQVAAAASAASKRALVSLVRHPNDVAMNSQMERMVLTMRGDRQPKNTALAMDPKREEWLQCCGALCPHNLHRHTLE